jgi:hypothetical protein
MSIEYYGPQPTINVENVDELWEALDLLHTQVMDNISDTSPLLEILEAAMDRVDEHRPDPA